MASRSQRASFDRGKLYREPWDDPVELTPRERALERAIMLGVAALYRFADEASAAPRQPTLELRAILALMFALSDGRRDPYDGFWHHSTDPMSWQKIPEQGAYLRGTHLRTEIQGIARGVNFPMTAKNMEPVHRAVRDVDRPTPRPSIKSS